MCTLVSDLSLSYRPSVTDLKPDCDGRTYLWRNSLPFLFFAVRQYVDIIHTSNLYGSVFDNLMILLMVESRVSPGLT